jgi:hypothetical protein
MNVSGQFRAYWKICCRGEFLRYSLDSRLNVPLTRPGRFGEKENILSLPEIDPYFSVTTPNELSWLKKNSSRGVI